MLLAEPIVALVVLMAEVAQGQELMTAVDQLVFHIPENMFIIDLPIVFAMRPETDQAVDTEPIRRRQELVVVLWDTVEYTTMVK